MNAGVPKGHPFFGNQYTDGGYIKKSFSYIPEIIEKGNDVIKSVVKKTGESVSPIAANKSADSVTPKTIFPKGSNKNALIIGGIVLVATTVGGFIAYKLLKKKAKTKQENLQSVELQNVGVCIKCGEPLIGSTYIPESEENSCDAYIGSPQQPLSRIRSRSRTQNCLQKASKIQAEKNGEKENAVSFGGSCTAGLHR